MPTGQPITLKCPHCKLGKYGYHRAKEMPQPVADALQRKEWRPTRRGHVLRVLTFVKCGDCGHEWWSTLPSKKSAILVDDPPMPRRRR